jgi:hypothetical protein
MDQLKALMEAVNLLKEAREKALFGPMRVWSYLLHAECHIQKQVDQVQAPELDRIFADPGEEPEEVLTNADMYGRDGSRALGLDPDSLAEATS